MSALPLEVSGLVKSYRTRQGELAAVRNISFAVRAGECLGLLGPNGAGKSTTMNCLTGFYGVSAGSVRIYGHDVHAQPRRARRHLGVCSQEDTLDTDFTVLGQMVRYARYFGLSLEEANQRALTLLDEFSLRDCANLMVEELSGGMRRRVQVARALLHRPGLLVWDEPTAGLDPEVRRGLWLIAKRHTAQGGALLLSTHYMEEAHILCDRVALMNEGVIEDCATPAELIRKHFGARAASASLEDVYLKVAARGTP